MVKIPNINKEENKPENLPENFINFLPIETELRIVIKTELRIVIKKSISDKFIIFFYMCLKVNIFIFFYF
jgi:hypothetical protein